MHLLQWIDAHEGFVAIIILALLVVTEAHHHIVVRRRERAASLREETLISQGIAADQQADRYRAAYERERAEAEKWRAVADVRRGA